MITYTSKYIHLIHRKLFSFLHEAVPFHNIGDFFLKTTSHKQVSKICEGEINYGNGTSYLSPKVLPVKAC